MTGAGGFIGGHLVEALLAQGFCVRCVDTDDCGRWSSDDPRREHHAVDCGDARQLRESRVLEGADFVFHLAGATKAVSLEQFRAWNVLPTRMLLQFLADEKIKLKRFVFVSSQAAAGPAPSLDRPLTEEDLPDPVGDYARSKLEAELTVREYARRIPCTILRPSSVYGPGDADFLTIFRQIQNHVCMFPDYRDRYIAILYVEDLIRGILQAGRSKKAEGRTYFLCADEPVQWDTLYRTIARVEEKWTIRFSVPRPVVELCGRAGDLCAKITGKYSIVNSQKVALSRPRFWVCSADRAKADFGFEVRVGLLEGLGQTYRWYKENGWL